MMIKLLSVQGILSFGLSFGSVFVNDLVVCICPSVSFYFFLYLSQDLYEKLQCNVDTAFLMTK